MSRLIDADVLIENLRNNVIGKNLIRLYNLNGFINAQPTVDAVPVSWINKHLEWLDNCDAQLSKGSILGMLELWRKDGMLNEQTN